MIPEERIRRALLNVERREVEGDIVQLEAAILHLQNEGKDNYDAAKASNDRQEAYDDSSDKILRDLENRLEERQGRLHCLIDELSLLSDE